jgi:hypothetical protein
MRQIREKQLQMDIPKSAPAVFKQRELQDDSEFPFGKWKGNQMQNVPNDFYTWFLKQDWSSRWPAVVTYAKKKLNIQ